MIVVEVENQTIDAGNKDDQALVQKTTKKAHGGGGAGFSGIACGNLTTQLKPKKVVSNFPLSLEGYLTLQSKPTRRNLKICHAATGSFGSHSGNNKSGPIAWATELCVQRNRVHGCKSGVLFLG